MGDDGFVVLFFDQEHSFATQNHPRTFSQKWKYDSIAGVEWAQIICVYLRFELNLVISVG